MRRKLFLAGLGFALLSLVNMSADEVMAQRGPRPSPGAMVKQRIGFTDVTVTYHRPGVKDRDIWGGLVPYNQVWRAGANEATFIEFSDDVKVNGQALPAGKYSFFTIPGEKEWTLIFNKATKRPGSDRDLWGLMYDGVKDQDALRLTVKPEAAPFQERLIYIFSNPSETSSDVTLWWAKLKVSFMVEVELPKSE
jgi:hypothetical protein